MKKNDLLKKFGDRYLISEHNGGYLLYDKEVSGRRANYQYKGKFYLSSCGSSYVFDEERYATPEELILAMEEWASTLPFDAEIYNPVYKKSYMIECALYDYLTSLGFESDNSYGRSYILCDAFGRQICNIHVDVEDGKSCGCVKRICAETKECAKWQEAKFTDLDSAIGACNTLVATYCTCVNSSVMLMMSKLTNSRVSEFYDKTFDIRAFTQYTEDGKAKAIEQLEAELKRLKEG